MAAEVRCTKLRKLVLVAGHAVYTAEDFTDPLGDGSWYLQDFQKGEAPFYLEHIRTGVELTDDCKKESLLVFSGGQTRYEAGARSEAQSYWALANHYDWFWRTNVRQRATTEEFARDSFENLLFGICRFHQAAKRMPERVIVVGWRFKEQRFELHRKAIALPDAQYQYIGANDPDDLAEAEKGEDGTYKDFELDPFGIRDTGRPILDDDGKVIKDKKGKEKRRQGLGETKEQRNPFCRRHPYDVSCTPLKELFDNIETCRRECQKDPDSGYQPPSFVWPKGR